jgi:hypothetical protein
MSDEPIRPDDEVEGHGPPDLAPPDLEKAMTDDEEPDVEAHGPPDLAPPDLAPPDLAPPDL